MVRGEGVLVRLEEWWRKILRDEISLDCGILCASEMFILCEKCSVRAFAFSGSLARKMC